MDVAALLMALGHACGTQDAVWAVVGLDIPGVGHQAAVYRSKERMSAGMSIYEFIIITFTSNWF